MGSEGKICQMVSGYSGQGPKQKVEINHVSWAGTQGAGTLEDSEMNHLEDAWEWKRAVFASGYWVISIIFLYLANDYISFKFSLTYHPDENPVSQVKLVPLSSFATLFPYSFFSHLSFNCLFLPF